MRNRSAAAEGAFHPPVSAELVEGGLRVKGKEGSRTYALSAITSVRLRHDDHEADRVGGIVLLSFGTGFFVAAATIVAVECSEPEKGGLFSRGIISALFAAPSAVIGFGLTIPGVILTYRGQSGRGLPPEERAERARVPQISLGPGSAGVTVPF